VMRSEASDNKLHCHAFDGIRQEMGFASDSSRAPRLVAVMAIHTGKQ